MNPAQRLWLVSLALVFAVLLGNYFLEWTTNYATEQARLLVPWKAEMEPVKVFKGADGSLNEFPADAAPQEIVKALGFPPLPQGYELDPAPGSKTTRLSQTGLFVRRARDASAAVALGAVLPGLLIGAAVYLALGGMRRHS